MLKKKLKKTERGSNINKQVNSQATPGPEEAPTTAPGGPQESPKRASKWTKNALRLLHDASS